MKHWYLTLILIFPLHARPAPETASDICSDIVLLTKSLPRDEQVAIADEISTIFTLTTTRAHNQAALDQLATIHAHVLAKSSREFTPKDFTSLFQASDHLAPVWKVLIILSACSLAYLATKVVKNHFASNVLDSNRGKLEQLRQNDMRTKSVVETLTQLSSAAEKMALQ